MSTPRTDKQAVNHIGFYSCETVPASLARELELELQQARFDVFELNSRLIDRAESHQQQTIRIESTWREKNQRLQKAIQCLILNYKDLLLDLDLDPETDEVLKQVQTLINN